MRHLSLGEDSHKGHKAMQRGFSVSGYLPLPRTLLKEGFGARIHLPRISSHLAALPLLWLQAGCGHIEVNTSILCGTGSGSPDWTMAQVLPCALETGLDTSCPTVFFFSSDTETTLCSAAKDPRLPRSRMARNFDDAGLENAASVAMKGFTYSESQSQVNFGDEQRAGLKYC